MTPDRDGTPAPARADEPPRGIDTGAQTILGPEMSGAPGNASQAVPQWVRGAVQGDTETRYGLKKIHASGGIGRIWLAHDHQLGREVAIKELLPENANDDRTVARFLREARLTGQLEHPAIVPVYELASQADGHFYAMRFVRGRTLSAAAHSYHRQRTAGRDAPLEFIALLTAFAAVCNAVAYAHARGVLHRDLKGDNVILGDFGEVIVLDWGLAKILGQADDWETGGTPPPDDQDAGLTLQGDVIGTPAYMAPEQAEGRSNEIDQRTDVFGLGAILYEILTSQPPFVGSNTLEVLTQASRGTHPLPRTLWAEVPTTLESICVKALAKDPNERHASASELAQEVQRWQDSQRREAEEALRQQTVILRSILDNMSDGVLVADASGKLIHMNPAAERMIGRPVEATLAGTRHAHVFYRPDGATLLAPIDMPSARALRGEDVNDVEMYIRGAAGDDGVWASANARPLRDGSGTIHGSVIVFRDVSERKRAEQELRRSRERFELAVRGSQDGIWDWDLRSGDVYFSPRWKSIIGYEDHELGHRIEEWEQRLHPDERAAVIAANAAHAAGTTPHYEYEYRLRHKDGSYRWILARGVALRDTSGKAYRMAGSHVDITERKKAEEERERLLNREREARAEAEAAVRVLEEAREALRASEEQYRSLADLIPGIVWTARPDGWIDYANRFWFDYTGFTLEQTQGSGWSAALHPDDFEKVSRVWSAALETGNLVEIAYRLKAADGVYRPFLARGRSLRDREGRVVKWFGILTELPGEAIVPSGS